MSDGLVPVRDRMLRGVPGCEQYHVPDFPDATMCNTIRLSRVARTHSSGRKVQVGGEAEKKEGPCGDAGRAFC